MRDRLQSISCVSAWLDADPIFYKRRNQRERAPLALLGQRQEVKEEEGEERKKKQQHKAILYAPGV